jgi:hypothetical protein
MEVSKPPKDVLELGQHLVHELGIENRFDTLGRWMAHHLAELIDKAENGATKAERLDARKNAEETILKIWKQRTSLPGKAYPLAPYRDVLLVLEKLKPDNSPFREFDFGTQAADKRELLAANLFDSLSRLIVAIVLMNVPSVEISKEINPASIEALDEKEERILTILKQFDDLFSPIEEEPKGAKNERERTTPVEINLEEAAIQLIDTISNSLVDLKNNLQENGKDK